jgi:hypothetical protein
MDSSAVMMQQTVNSQQSASRSTSGVRVAVTPTEEVPLYKLKVNTRMINELNIFQDVINYI